MFTERRVLIIVGLGALIAVGTASCLEPSEDVGLGDAAAADASVETGDAAKTCDLVGDRCEGEGCCGGRPMTGTLMDLERNCSMPPERVFGCSGQTPSGACVPRTFLRSCVQRLTEAGTEVFGTNSGFLTNLKMIDPAYEACPDEVERQVLAIDTRCDE